MLFVLLLASPLCAGTITRPRCGTPERLRVFSMGALNEKQQLMDVFRPELQTSIVSSRGHFRIHFDTTGVNLPALVDAEGNRIEGTWRAFVDSAAKIFDAVWQREVSHFGFPAPASDHGAGGGDEYDVYIAEMIPGLYGLTQPEGALPDAQSKAPSLLSSYIEVDNDFGRGYPTKGLAG
ncbi:MAG: hypothetical protein ACM3Q4_01915, partial [Acidobacteriota bacterium]